ncbi:hypothetical protein [Leeuwenhoekiella sp. H156]|uniref:hypothetical protein n=1 Tax=Leeuwenhoekiella sp. H156 TaxID=3450128 RepID=UPI003FA41A1F
MKKTISLLILMTVAFTGLKAQDVKDYKYVVVPQKFDFQDEAGQYDLNALARFLFIKWGFDAYLENEELPADLNASGCNTLYTRADVGGFLTTKANIKLVNCKGQTVFEIPEGKSKIKEFKAGHQEAFRRAFEGLEELGYTYSDEIVESAEVSEETETLIPEARKTMPQPAETKTVKVSAVPKNGNIEVKEVLEVAEQNTAEQKPDKNEALVEKKVESNLVSEDGSYSLRPVSSGFDVYEGESKIGTATKTSNGSYLVSTSEFTGIGYYNGSEFTVEREIKGVSGLVKMVFTR